MHRLATVDAQTFWMSAKIPSDQFLLYGFSGVPADLGRVLDELRVRAARCPDLTLKVAEGSALTYPAWVGRDVAASQLIVHELADADWAGCLAAVCALTERQLDATESTWRLHVFAPVSDLPGADGPGTVVVLQVAHALGDGVRSSALAAWLFGRAATIPSASPPAPFRTLTLPVRGWRAARAHRQLERDVAAGDVPAQADSRPALKTNARPTGPRSIRTVVRHRRQLPGPTVTTGVMSAISTALAGHLRELGDDPAALGAEVPMAKAGARRANNHFGNVGIGLFPGLDTAERAGRIAADLTLRRRRAAHPAMQAAALASAAVPAPLLRWGVAQFDPAARSPIVTGNTVVSSVNRGAADLTFGAAPVVLTAGFPALSPMMGLTHGVHGIGDTVVVSVYAAQAAIGDVDAYVGRLGAAL